MKAHPLALAGVMVLEPKIFTDARGSFFESFNKETFARETGSRREFVQDNHSVSAKGVLRGLHYQLPPHAQGKLVRVLRGAVFDVAVDLRRASSMFGRWTGVLLSAENHNQLWIPEGFAHGFLAITEAEVLYKTTALYAATHERAIIWNDRAIGIDWPADAAPMLSEKDAAAVGFDVAELFD